MADGSSKISSIRHIALGDTVYLPSLEDLSIVKVVVALRKSEDPKLLVPREIQYTGEALNELNDKICKKISQLNLPENLTSRIRCFIAGMSKEVKEWFDQGQGFQYTLEEAPYNPKALVSDFVRTSQGTIHEEKTALILTQREDLNLMTRYKIAYVFNLEDQLPILRERLQNHPEYSNVYFDRSIMELEARLPAVWNLKSKFLESLCGFLYSRKSFWLEKLSADPKKTEEVVSEFIRSPCAWSDAKFSTLHLLSNRTKDLKNYIIKNYSLFILGCYYKGLPHPMWKYLFVETSKFLMLFLTKNDILYFISLICGSIFREKSSLEFKIILTEFLNILTKCGKADFGEDICPYFHSLIEVGDAKHIIMILEQSNSEARISFFSYLSGRILKYNNLEFYKFLIRNCEMTKVELEGLLQLIGGEDFDDFRLTSFCTRVGFLIDDLTKMSSEDKINVMEFLKEMIRICVR